VWDFNEICYRCLTVWSSVRKWVAVVARHCSGARVSQLRSGKQRLQLTERVGERAADNRQQPQQEVQDKQMKSSSVRIQAQNMSRGRSRMLFACIIVRAVPRRKSALTFSDSIASMSVHIDCAWGPSHSSFVGTAHAADKMATKHRSERSREHGVSCTQVSSLTSPAWQALKATQRTACEPRQLRENALSSAQPVWRHSFNFSPRQKGTQTSRRVLPYLQLSPSAAGVRPRQATEESSGWFVFRALRKRKCGGAASREWCHTRAAA